MDIRAAESNTLPRVGMLATLRNRRGVVTSVEPFNTTPEGRIHLVHVEYTDADGMPEDAVIWEREHNATLLEPTALPRIGNDPSMLPADFDALVRACHDTVGRELAAGFFEAPWCGRRAGCE